MTNKEPIYLAWGPMSSEAVEAVFRYSNLHRKPLALIASKNQIDYKGGYVQNWTTESYMRFIGEMKMKYPYAQVKICRDHCGPGFNGNYDISDTYATIEEDIKQGFDSIHIDFCHYKGLNDERLEATKKAVLYCLSLNPSLQLEIGTDENTGENYSLPNLAAWEREVDFFRSFCNPEFYVVQTGSLVKEINQVGTFNKAFVEKVAEMFKAKGLKLKEHNADYLSKEDIDLRRGIVHAQNIAPQIGVIQTQTVLTKCLMYGVRTDKFLSEVYDGGKWKKWMWRSTAENVLLCAVIAGHYHFSSASYRHMIDELAQCEDIRETIINQIEMVISHYVGE